MLWLVALGASPAVAQTYPAGGCSWPGGSIPVYFAPGALATSGYDVTAYRNSLLNSLAVWNEESGANIDLYYAGDTTATAGIPNAIVVNHTAFWGAPCTDLTSLARAFFPASGACGGGGGGGPILWVILGSGCGTGDYLWTPVWATTGAISYESVITHEIGHTLGFPDVTTTVGVMHASYTESASALHLYTIDYNSLRAKMGGTSRYASSIASSSVTGPWTSPTAVPPPSGTGAAASLAPSVERHYAEPGRFNGFGVSHGPSTSGRFRRMESGNPGSASERALGGLGLPNPELWVTGATAPSGAVMAAWLTGCTRTGGCNISWAWFASPTAVVGSSGTLTSIGTFARPDLTYDTFRSRYVLSWIDEQTGRIRTTHHAGGTGALWFAPTISSSTIGGTAERFRFLGGMSFAPDGTGQFAAGHYMTVAGSTQVGQLRRGAVTVVSGNYQIASTSGFSASATSYQTRRHFGITVRMEAGTPRWMVAWRGTSATRGWTWASRTTGDYSAPLEGIAGVVNSVDVGTEEGLNRFVGGLSW